MTSRAQQVGIWIIAVTMTVGTIGGFVAIILANENQQKAQDQATASYQAQLDAAEDAAKQSAADSEPIEGYSSAPFDAATVTALQSEVLVEGTGEAVKETDTIKASYFGWLSDGTIFDSSKKRNLENTPIAFPLSGVIEGWTKGLADKKVGSIVKLTIPASQAYGAQAQSIIPANSPLQFIVKIESIETAQS